MLRAAWIDFKEVTYYFQPPPLSTLIKAIGLGVCISVCEYAEEGEPILHLLQL